MRSYSTNSGTFLTSILEGTKWKAKSQVVEGIPEGKQCALPPPTQTSTVMVDKETLNDDGINQDKFLLHQDDPANFLKLCAAIRILLRCQLTDSHIDHADQLIREYCTKLISVRL